MNQNWTKHEQKRDQKWQNRPTLKEKINQKGTENGKYAPKM